MYICIVVESKLTEIYTNPLVVSYTEDRSKSTSVNIRHAMNSCHSNYSHQVSFLMCLIISFTDVQ